MNLINIEQTAIGEDLIETVNARELHAFLESKQQFGNWIANRIEQYGFVEGVDFTVNKFINGRATQIDYHISIDMAKELSMVERNEKGKQARQYFIECERVAKSKLNTNLPTIQDPQLAAMVTMLTQLDQVKQEQGAQRLELAELKAKLTSTPTDYYTVAGYASLRGLNIDVKRANVLGRRASKLSREYGIEINKAHSEVFGAVNTYHVDVLCEVFN